jgi:hypothetical protein
MLCFWLEVNAHYVVHEGWMVLDVQPAKVKA